METFMIGIQAFWFTVCFVLGLGLSIGFLVWLSDKLFYNGKRK